jgi:hypothetical protein
MLKPITVVVRLPKKIPALVERILLELFPRPRCLTPLGGVGDLRGVGILVGVGDLPVKVTPDGKGVLVGVGDLALVVEDLDKDLLLAAGSSLSDASPAIKIDELPDVAALFLLE